MEDEQEKRSIEDAKKVNALFDLAIGALLGLAISVAIKTIIKSGKPFQFKNFETIAAKADAIFKKLSDLVTDLIKGGIEREWSVANAERDAQVLTLLGKEALGIKAFKAYFTHNNEGAMTAFINRAKTEEGLKLSEKIWKYSNLQLRQELEAALQTGIAEGKSAQALARQVRKYLQNPDLLLNKTRKLKLEFANRIKGRGIYKSSVKNSMRLTITEINMAYHTADHLRRLEADFIVGFEVHTSSNHLIEDICDELKGKYPKTFKFVGWHPTCRCYTTDILISREELTRVTMAKMNGNEVKGFRSVNQVDEVPNNFIQWVETNKERVNNWASLPYFLMDNLDFVPEVKALL